MGGKFTYNKNFVRITLRYSNNCYNGEITANIDGFNGLSNAYEIAEYLGYYFQHGTVEVYNNQFVSFDGYRLNYNELIQKLQPYFECSISELDYIYEIGIFDESIKILVEEKPPVPLPPQGLTVTLFLANPSNDKIEDEETFFINGLDVTTFAIDLSLINKIVPYPTGCWALFNWYEDSQSYYLQLLYEKYGHLIKHKYNSEKYNYYLSASDNFD